MQNSWARKNISTFRQYQFLSAVPPPPAEAVVVVVVVVVVIVVVVVVVVVMVVVVVSNQIFISLGKLYTKFFLVHSLFIYL